MDLIGVLWPAGAEGTPQDQIAYLRKLRVMLADRLRMSLEAGVDSESARTHAFARAITITMLDARIRELSGETWAYHEPFPEAFIKTFSVSQSSRPATQDDDAVTSRFVSPAIAIAGTCDAM